MGFVAHAEEPSDFWRLTGVDDPTTPPSLARVLNTVGTREEWRRAGLPVLFDEAGEVRHVQRGGREYRFEHLGADAAAGAPHCRPLT
ncbi:MAG TPA: hypothetical protein VMG32_12625 [Anaeromyxobacteraceae bacterium]|nr:hypothetical protein [Anaeromyxobacteraceae bacterium]